MVMIGNGNLNLFGQQNDYRACGAGDFFVFSFIFVWGTGFDAEALYYSPCPWFSIFYT